MEFDALSHCKGDGAAIFAHGPAFSQIRLIARFQIQRVKVNQSAVDVAADVRTRKLKALSGVNCGDVVNPIGDHQHVCWCLSHSSDGR